MVIKDVNGELRRALRIPHRTLLGPPWPVSPRVPSRFGSELIFAGLGDPSYAAGLLRTNDRTQPPDGPHRVPFCSIGRSGWVANSSRKLMLGSTFQTHSRPSRAPSLHPPQRAGCRTRNLMYPRSVYVSIYTKENLNVNKSYVCAKPGRACVANPMRCVSSYRIDRQVVILSIGLH